MEKLAEIMSVVARYMDISASDILTRRKDVAMKAHRFVCHIIRNGFPSYEKSYRTMTNISFLDFYSEAENAENEISKDTEAKVVMNMIRNELGLKSIKMEQDYDSYDEGRSISATMQLFGFDYTEEETLRRRQAIMDAAMWFRKEYGSLGDKPLKDGCVYTRE